MSSNKSVRYSAEHKQETRERIVRSAFRHFRRRGEGGVGIADLMNKLNLTHGGFYKHFGSKDELLAEAILKAFEETESGLMAAVSKAKPGNELRMIIDHYLDLDHCDNPAGGCPVAALVSEIGRYPRPVRLEINKAMRDRTRKLARFLPGKTEKERERNCLVLISGMVGAVNLARATVDPERRKTILAAARDFYLKAFCS
jgi:TetR/AcrR family transcriptional repressor of nem operon